MGMEIKRFNVFLVNLDPTVGSEIQKARPCVIISPDEMNRHIRTVIIAPMTTQKRNYPTRVSVRFSGKNGQVVLDQIRTIDKSRLIKHLGQFTSKQSDRVLSVLQEMFAL